jgi:predicted MPP superfamily phosphohydrolase
MGATVRTLVGITGAAALGLGYSLLEARSHRLRRVEVPVLPPGRPSVRLLHLSDLHLTPQTTGRISWVRQLAALSPDAVVVTGDFLSHQDAVPLVVDALDPLLGLPGVFVLGSNDYYAPAPVRPWRYLMGPSGLSTKRAELPWKDLVTALTGAGWRDLSNSRATLSVAGLGVDVRGVDDPHIHRDHYADVAGPFDGDADLSLGVTHAPYRRVLDAMTDDGAGLVLAGHTHGGQVCVPGFGALLTNCDLPPAQAKGLSRHARTYQPGSDPDLGGVDGRGAFLHVSAGLGTSPYAPVRFACPPEATLLTLTAVPA